MTQIVTEHSPYELVIYLKKKNDFTSGNMSKTLYFEMYLALLS